MRGLLAVVAVAAACALPTAALAAFPYQRQGAPDDYTSFWLPSDAPRPNDLGGKLDWMYASTPPAGSPLTADKRELGGVRGAWVVDKDGSAPQAWATTTGRPDVTIAVLDSGVQWNDYGKPMNDVRLKTRISTGETPLPKADRTTPTDALVTDCSALATRAGKRDLNGDGVFNILDYACDSRVDPAPARGVGPTVNGRPLLDPQDVLIAFTDGDDADGNGYADDIVGWDFLDDDNDPFDDVQYGHGSGESMDSAGEADNGGDLGTCPNCMEIHLRVGTSFVADVNRFALATIYATDNGVNVVQEALGTLNKSRVGFDAVKYAYDHGTTVIASAADEAAQHHNWPSSYPYSIVVNSVTHTDDADPGPTSYLQFNGCTNFSSRITLAIPSVSCSSDATGRGAGMAGLVYSAALNAREKGQLDPHPACRRTDGSACVITPNEVRQVMASGTFNGTPAADDINFAQDPVTGADIDNACGGNPIPGCNDPFAPLAASSPRLTAPMSYPARKGHDQFYGYGRVNMHRAVTSVTKLPPEVEVTSPDWYEMVDSTRSSFDIKAEVWDRGKPFTCKVYVAPGAYPKDTAAPNGDFVEIPSACGKDPQTDRIDGVIATVATSELKALFPPTAGDFTGQEGGTTGQTPNPGGNVGRPNDEPYSFVVKVVATSASGGLSGADRRQAYLHRDKDLLPGFPKQLPGDVEASPVLADLDGDNRNELVLANSDGIVHAWKRDGSELKGWPFHTDELPLHPQSRAFSTGAVKRAFGAVLATPAVGDLDRDGTLEVVVADMESKVYVIDGETGKLEDKFRTRIEYSGKPLEPFVNVRGVDADGNFQRPLAHMHRLQHGFIGAPVLADIDQDDNGKLEIVAGALDGHVYVWNADGTDVPGWPLPIVDRSKLRTTQPQFDPETQRPFYDMAKAGGGQDQGAIIATPAVGDLDGDGKPEIVVGTNENYSDGKGGESFNGGGVNNAAYQILGQALALANGRLYAIRGSGDADGDPNTGAAPWLPGWPFKVGILQQGILPLVGEGISGSPVIGNVPCQGTTRARRVGVIPAAGVPYVVDRNGQSCYGRDPQNKDIGLNTEGGAASDQPVLAAFGHPAFAELTGGTAFLAPSAGVQRAADVVLPEYQGGQDYLVAWDLQLPQGTIKAGWPAPMNDLQFLTGPSIADISSEPGEEVVEGSAHHDFQGISSAGSKLPGWPKLSADWTVANPAIGSFGQLETDEKATRVVVDGTRNGRLVAYSTGADPCGAASWPQFHHDPANSGDLNRDAVAPGTPISASVSSGEIHFISPGDDLLCGKPKAYEVRTSDAPITPANFARAKPLAVEGRVLEAGANAELSLPLTGVERYVALRAVDEQGNVGRPAAVAIFGGGPAPQPPADSGGETAAPDGAPPAEAPVVPRADAGAETAAPGSNEVAGERAASAPAPAATAPASRCVSSHLRITRRSIGAARLGATRARTLRRLGTPGRSSKRFASWCVRGGGALRVAFTRNRVQRITLARPGLRTRTLRTKR